MADYTSIVEAGEAFIDLLRDEMVPEPIGDKELISLASPYEPENNLLTVHLFHVEEEPFESFGKYMRESANMDRQQPANFTLNYLLTAHSKAPAHLKETDQQRVIGRAIQIIRDTVFIPIKYYKGSLADTLTTRLALTLERPNYDQMSKIWGSNNQNPYKLSIVCKVRGVLVESRNVRRFTRVTQGNIGIERVSVPGDPDYDEMKSIHETQEKR